MEYLPLLFRLKWTLMWRGYQRNKMVLISIILLLLIFTPMAVGMAVGAWFGFVKLSPPYDWYLLRAVLLLIYLAWAFAPLLGFALNESYDITKLFLYPVSPRQLFIGAIFGSLIDFPVLLASPLLLAALLGFTHGIGTFIFTAVVLLLFLFHTLAFSQALLLLSAGMLRSRRWRDLMVVIGPLLAAAWYVLFQIVPRYVGQIDWLAFLDNAFWRTGNFLPPGFAAQAVGAAQEGAWLPALGFLALLAAATAGTIYWAGYLVQLVATGEMVNDPVRARKTARGGQSVPFFDRWLPPVVSAMVEKELKYLVRDPYFKAMLANALYMLAVFVVAFLRPWEHEDRMAIDPSNLWFMLTMSLFFGASLLFNLFGTEGFAATTLFSFPSSRRQMFIGKNLVLSSALLLMNLLLMLSVTLLTHSLTLFLRIGFLQFTAVLVFTAIGNVVSVRAPHRIVMRGMRMQQQSAGKGCGYGLAYLGATLTGFGLILPLAAAVIVPTYWVNPAWFALTLPLSLAYAAGLYWLSLGIAASDMRQREVEMIGQLAKEEE